jgi:polysaccharide export outer membrane protein
VNLALASVGRRAALVWLAASLLACGSAPQTSTLPTVGPPASNLGPGDTFEVSVYGEEDLSGKYRVAEDGAINFPLVGRIEAAGKTTAEIATAIRDQLRERKLLRDPHVSVFLLEQTSKQVAVVGAVAKPGSYPLINSMTVVQAISAAGGLSALASGDNSIVTRKVDGQLKRFKVPIEAMAEGRANDFALQPGDIVFVPERIF